jgi:hypothetical protein
MSTFDNSATSQIIKGNFDEADQLARKAARVNQTMQRGRLTENMRSTDAPIMGLIKGTAFETMFIASSQVAQQIASKVTVGGVAGRITSEIAGGLIAMAASSVVTANALPGTDRNAREEFDYVLQSLRDIASQVWQSAEKWFSDVTTTGDAVDTETQEAIAMNISTVTESLSTDEKLQNIGTGPTVEFMDGDGNEIQQVA